jgi:plastocyanin
MKLPQPRLTLAIAGALLVAIATLYARVALTADEAMPDQIVMKDFTFTPMSLTVKAGTTVMWANKDDEPHTVVSDSGLFRSGAIDTDGTFSFRFDRPGTYHFVCSIHPKMVGTVVVQ